MERRLVIPQDLVDKLNAAYADIPTKNKWVAIGVNNVNEMIQRIIDDLNNKNPKLSIISHRVESNTDIKDRIENSGTTSKFGGYIENNKGNIEALFFYIEPNVGSANDFLSRYVMPSILGIYKSVEKRTKDMHINYMPVYIVSLCSTSRIGNDSVKRTIICAETMGFDYLDVFNNTYKEVINRFDANGDPITTIETLQELDDFLKYSGTNEYFDLNVAAKTMTILSGRFTANNSNVTAELYRYVLRVIPATYMASNEGYNIDATSLATITNDSVTLIKEYMEKF